MGGGEESRERPNRAAHTGSEDAPDPRVARRRGEEGDVARQGAALQQRRRVQRDILAYQNGFATSAENASSWKQFTLLIKRNKAASIGIAAVLLVGATLGTKAFVEGKRAEREAVHAKNEAARAQRGEALAQSEATRANAALARLRGTAPTFFAQAQALIEKQQFADALEKISYAIELAPGDASYHFLKGNILESLSRLADARAAYDDALRLDPAHAFARENRDLCAEILAEEKGGGELGKPSLHKLNLLMRREGRTAEAIATLRESAKDRQALMDTWCAVLAKTGLPVGDSHFPYGLTLSDDGLFDLSLGGRKINGKPLDDISFLRGMPLRKLTIDNTSVSDLTPLAGARLEVLNISHTSVSDLRPLSGMKLTELNLAYSKVTDLTPLHGVPLHILNLGVTDVTDLHPVIGMPLEDLNLYQTKVEDITPLRGLKLRRLEMGGLNKIKSLDPLSGMPLVFLSFTGTAVTDLTPLIGMRLESIAFTDTPVNDLRPLKGMPLTVFSKGGRSKLADLTPLVGMKLTVFTIGFSLVTDLSPVRDQPIEIANINDTGIEDFSALATWPLRELGVQKTKFKDLQVLAGKRLEKLFLTETPVADISVLRTMPLRELMLYGTQVTDFHPLADIPTLNLLTLPAGAKDIEFLRHKPGLQKLGFTSYPNDAPPVEQFWKEYDAQQAAGKK
jgi:eukaryotic-like serine/threonine-protein kinase